MNNPESDSSNADARYFQRGMFVHHDVCSSCGSALLYFIGPYLKQVVYPFEAIPTCSCPESAVKPLTLMSGVIGPLIEG